MALEILGHGLAVVLVGKFNPAIVSPAWLASIDLITQADVENAELQVIHPQVTEFTVGKFTVFVDVDRFQISTTQEPFVEVSDWIGVIFGTKLKYTPITSAGINYSGHFALASNEQRHKLGRSLAPVGPWGAWGSTLESFDKPDERAGLRSLTMIQPSVDGRKKGHIQAKIEPSVRGDIVSTAVGVFMHVNDHYELVEPDVSAGPTECVDWLVGNLESSVERAKSMIADVKAYAEAL